MLVSWSPSEDRAPVFFSTSTFPGDLNAFVPAVDFPFPPRRDALGKRSLRYLPSCP